MAMNYAKRIKNLIKGRPQLSFSLLFLLAWITASCIFFLRFPNNFFEPNFYAEDGSIFLSNIEQMGFVQALLTPFNGYFIFGLYLLEGIGYVINFIFFQNELVNLAKSFAIVSYAFLGLVCTLPLLLFKNYLKPAAIILILLLSVFVPIPGSDYAIIGTIGNLKFIFVYLAFLLLVYRHLIPESSTKQFIAIDLILAICAYTNVVVYLLLPFALLRYLPLLRKKKFKQIFTTRSFQILFTLGLLLVPQIIMIKIFGIPATPGYLDTPYRPESTANMFLYRSYLFPFLSPFTKFMNDMLVVGLFTGLSALLWFGLKSYRQVLVFGLLTVLLTTGLFVMNRPGVSELYLTYAGSGPDQFFYTQNLIICFLVGIAFTAILFKIRNQTVALIGFGFVIIAALALYAPSAGTYGKNDFMQQNVGNIYAVAKEACNDNSSHPTLQMYPIVSDAFQIKNIAREKICTPSVSSYVPDIDYLPLTAQPGTIIPDVQRDKTTQTFRAEYNGLSGVSLMVLTYQQLIIDHYTLTVYEHDCQTVVRTIKINRYTVHDAAFNRIDFPRIPNSKHKAYCLALTLSGQKTVPLALSVSQPNQYPEGILTVNGIARHDDLVMRLHYSK